MPYRLTAPKKTVIGENALETCRADITALGCKALIVTGKHVEQTGAMRILLGLLTQWEVGYIVFSGITGEPTVAMIDEGVAAYRDAGCDFLIAIGGGSPLDSAKAIAAMIVLPGAISDYMGKEIEGKFPPMVLIPTTAGTGSEATKFTIITDPVHDVKMLLKGDALLPDLAVVDPAFTLTSPPSVTVATGMDALTHAIEAYTSRRANPFTDALALDAITCIFRSLPEAFKDGGNRKAREDMAIAAHHAGLCINNASVTLVHGMSRPIGALFHVAHGISNAMILRPCLAFAMEGCPERFAAMARAIGAAEGSGSTKDGAEAFLTALDSLCNQVEIPSLAQHGIDRARFLALIDKMATDALASGSPGNTIREVTKEDLMGIYQSLW